MSLETNVFVGLSSAPCECCGGTGRIIPDAYVGARLRELRIKAGVTQKAIADRMGFKTPYMVDLEKGRRAWNADRIAAYQKALVAAEKERNDVL